MASKQQQRSPGARAGMLAACMGLNLSLVGGCGGGESIELVAIRGCGLDQTFSGLRVRVVGDLTPGAGSELLLGPGERGSMPALPDEATGVVAQGLFGTTATAVGRSFGVDGELARGRVPGFDTDAPLLTVYFAAPDSWCEVASSPGRREAASAAGPAGDVLLVGGVAADGALLDELVHHDLFTGDTRSLDASLPTARRGHVVHALASARSFVVVGGARANEVLDEWLVVDVAGSGSVAASGRLEHALTDAAHARSPVDGRVLLAGGCELVDAVARCDPGSAHARAAWLEVDVLARGQGGVEQLPDLTASRVGAHAVVGHDGVAWVAGGLGLDGLGLSTVERLRPGDDAWSVVHTLPDERVAAGITVLDGGLVVLAEAAGPIHWWSEAGSGELDPLSRAPALEPVTTARPLTTLPGERVLVDNWLFAPASAAVDPGLERVMLSTEARSGALALGLDDGTLLLIGGRELSSGELAEPSLLRVRPELDGPDEWTPDLAGPQTDAFVTNAPGRATVVVGGLRLDALGDAIDALPPVRAHVRGFRSRSVRLEFQHEVDAGTAAHVIVEQGSSVVAIELGTGLVRRRSADGSTHVLDCSDTPGTSPWVLELDGDELRLDGDGRAVARCEVAWPSSAGVAVGFGVSGSGSARFFDLRLARI